MKNKKSAIFAAAGVILWAGMILGLASGTFLCGFSGGADGTDIKVYDIYTKKEDCRLWVSYQNSGTTTINAGLRVKVTVQNAIVENVIQGFSLGPGQFFNVGVGSDPGYKLFGVNRTVTATVDADNALVESDESNNTLTKTMGCSTIHSTATSMAAGKPDLCIPYIKFVVVTEGDDAVGHYVTFNAIVYVKNVGQGGCGPFDVLLEYKINGVGPYLTCPTCKIHVSGLSAKQGLELPARQFTKRGTQTSGQAIFFQATADCDNVREETDETNNVCKDSYQGQALHK